MNSNSNVEIRTSAVGGLGLFAIRNFEVGDVILVEQPLVMVPGLEWENMDSALIDESTSSTKIQSGEVSDCPL